MVIIMNVMILLHIPKIKIILYAVTFLFYASIFVFSLKIGLFKKILSKKKIFCNMIKEI